MTFNSDRFMTSDTHALGEAIEQTTSYTRVGTSNLVETVTDELGRVTRYTYDTKGNVATVTRLYGTGDAVTTTYTSDPTYSLPTSVTDPLSHTTTFAYDSPGADPVVDGCAEPSDDLHDQCRRAGAVGHGSALEGDGVRLRRRRSRQRRDAARTHGRRGSRTRPGG